MINMKKNHIIILSVAVMLMAVLPIHSFAQQQYAVPEQIIKVFPTASTLNKEGVWSRVLDTKGTLLGYVAYSKPASDGIQGFNGETPLMYAIYSSCFCYSLCVFLEFMMILPSLE